MLGRQKQYPNVAVIVQARLGSTRLPGKVLHVIEGKTVLEHVVEKIRRSRHKHQLIIAIPDEKTDNLLEEACLTLGVRCYRASQNNVLERYYLAAKHVNANIVVRVTSDCPLLDTDLLDEMLDHFLTHEHCDYLSNTIKRTYPRGMDIEIFTFEALSKAYQLANTNPEKEHVTPYIYQHPEQFRIITHYTNSDDSDLRVTLDTVEDLRVISILIAEGKTTLGSIISFLRKNPEIVAINKSVQQKIV